MKRWLERFASEYWRWKANRSIDQINKVVGIFVEQGSVRDIQRLAAQLREEPTFNGARELADKLDAQAEIIVLERVFKV